MARPKKNIHMMPQYNVPDQSTAIERISRGLLGGLGTGLNSALQSQIQARQSPQQRESSLIAQLSPEQQLNYMYKQKESEKSLFDRLSPAQQWKAINDRLNETKQQEMQQRVSQASQNALSPEELSMGKINQPTILKEQELHKENETIKPQISQEKISPTDYYNYLINNGVSQKSAKDMASLYQQEYKEEKSRSAKEEEKSRTGYELLRTQGKAAKDNLNRLDRMEKLVEKKNLPYPEIASLVDTAKHGIAGYGIDFSGNLSTDAQEFIKLSNEFIKDIKNYFPGRITNLDLQTFMSTIPNLKMNDAAKKRVISNLRLVNKAAQLHYKTAKDIVQEHKGKIPKNLNDLIEHKIGKQLDTLSKKFIEGNENNAEESQEQGLFSSLFHGTLEKARYPETVARNLLSQGYNAFTNQMNQGLLSQTLNAQNKKFNPSER